MKYFSPSRRLLIWFSTATLGMAFFGAAITTALILFFEGIWLVLGQLLNVMF